MSFLLKLEGEVHDQQAAAAARVGVSMQIYARDAIDAATQEDEILRLAAAALAGYGEAGLKVAGLRSRARAVAGNW
jgi:hypothetical protein